MNGSKSTDIFRRCFEYRNLMLCEADDFRITSTNTSAIRSYAEIIEIIALFGLRCQQCAYVEVIAFLLCRHCHDRVRHPSKVISVSQAGSLCDNLSGDTAKKGRLCLDRNTKGSCQCVATDKDIIYPTSSSSSSPPPKIYSTSKSLHHSC
jgi:hypothetical protein